MKIIYKGKASGPEQKKASQAFAKGNYKEAQDLWSDILEKNDSDPLALKGLALCALLEDRIREANSYLEDAVSVAANDEELYNLIALIHLKKKDPLTAINALLDAQDRFSSLLLQDTLKKMQNSKNTNSLSIFPLIQITLPKSKIFSLNDAQKKIINQNSAWFILFAFLILFFLFYPSIRNVVLRVRAGSRGGISFAQKADIKDIKQIIDARSNYSLVFTEQQIQQKYQDLQSALSDNQMNKARIFVNELKASNASLAIKERLYILEGFIPTEITDNLDYIPSYQEVAIAPEIYQGVGVRWQGTVANFQHQGRRATFFDLFINRQEDGQVEGIANVMIDGYHEFQNGNNLIIIGIIEGITADNRIIIKAIKILRR